MDNKRIIPLPKWWYEKYGNRQAIENWENLYLMKPKPIKNMKKELNVGDKIKRVCPYNIRIIEIYRVTNTEAVGIYKDEEGYMHEMRFQRSYDLWDEHTGQCKLIVVPRQSGISLIEWYIIF